MVEGMQCGGWCANRGDTSSVQMRVCSTEQAHHQYRGGLSSVWMQVYSTKEAHHQYE